MENVSLWGVIVGRFQTPYIHQGHLDLIKAVSDKHPNVLVLIGIRPTLMSNVHPLSYAMREAMLRHAVGTDLVIAPLGDNRDDVEWSRNLDHTIRMITGNQSATLYTGRDGFKPHYTENLNVVELDLPHPDINSTDIRAKVNAKDYERTTSITQFRAGIVYAMNALPKLSFMTVDMAVLGPDNDVLLVRKPNEKALRFPGGMFDPGDDESFEYTASRELYEETKLDVVDWEYIGNTPVQDWRSDGIDQQNWHTMFFCGPVLEGQSACPSDDLAGGEVRWVSLDEQLYGSNALVDEHWNLWKMLIAHLEGE